MSFTIAGRSAILTGAANGISLAVSERLLSSGLSSLIAVDLNPQVEEVARAMKEKYPKAEIIPIVADVTDASAMASAFSTPLPSPLSIVGNCAGIGGMDWERTISVDLNGVIMGTQMGLKRMKEEGTDGVVVNISSMAGLAPMSFDPAYTAAKHGVVGYSRCFSHLHSKRGIRVNCLCPAFVDTPLVRGLMDDPRLGKAGRDAVESLGGMMDMDVVTGAFMDLVEREEYNSAVLTVTKGGGVMKMKFPFGDNPIYTSVEE
mmetsp:Transcript_13647/g.27911  ORF Transcript_13647/g.27911 Transcript_13647/m.27911 type:complete len:260 (-) Transcript_13647:99-878(-)